MDKMELDSLAYLNPSTKIGIIKAIMVDYDQYDDDTCEIEEQQQEVVTETINVLINSLEGEIGFADLFRRLQE